MFSGRSRSFSLALGVVAALSGLLGHGVAQACGCFSPPVSFDDFEISQQAEQIIFEVDEAAGQVTAHVSIRYVGDPASFAWLVPVPNIVDVEVSEALLAFSLLDQTTRVRTQVETRNLCPDPAYFCAYNSECFPPEEPSSGGWGGDGDGDGDGDEGGDGDGDGDGDGGAGPVMIELEKTVGDYEIVVFSAENAGDTVQWLQDNGFIVNETMAPYMQPYLDAGMMFLAAKLVPGADADAITPLSMTYQGDKPMIPLQLTAVAAEPHLPVVSYIYGSELYRPVDQPLVEIDPQGLAEGPQGHNYPALLSRTLDEHGGAAFVAEYAGQPPELPVGQGSCCSDEDPCELGGDGICQCPRHDFDREDCDAESPKLVESVAFLDELSSKHERVTRLITRLSPEEMRFDPVFRPATNVEPGQLEFPNNSLTLYSSQLSLSGCTKDVLAPEIFERVTSSGRCSALYCGSGDCTIDEDGSAGCDCDAGSVARAYTDLDGSVSVTCVPDIPPVDLSVDLELADACQGIDCGQGTCIDLNGVATCQCEKDMMATLIGSSGTLECVPIAVSTGGPGADNYSHQLKEVPVCAPPPPGCGHGGWLIRRPSTSNQGVLCESSIPAPEELIPPDCSSEEEDAENDVDAGSQNEGGDGSGGCSCRSTRDQKTSLFSLLALILMGLTRRRGASKGRA